MSDLERANVTAHTLANAVKIRRAVYYQPPGGGRPQLLISAQELDEMKMTQDRWIGEQKKRLGAEAGSGRGDDRRPAEEPARATEAAPPAEASTGFRAE